MSTRDSTILLAALPREVQGLVRGLKPDPDARARGVIVYRLPHAVVAVAGMGATRVTLAFQAALALAGTPALVLSTGLAGACVAALSPGEVVEAGVVIDAMTGERYQAETSSRTVLASGDTIASVAEKARLATTYLAELVDMEAAAVGRLARAHGLPFRAVKAISDAHDFELAALSRFTGKQGQFRTAAFAMHTALHPRSWSAAARLGGNSSRALAALDQRLRQILS